MSLILLRRMLLSFGQTPDSLNRELICFAQNDIKSITSSDPIMLFCILKREAYKVNKNAVLIFLFRNAFSLFQADIGLNNNPKYVSAF